MTTAPTLRRRWLFADQLGPHFLDQPDQPVLLIESRAVFRRRRFHRQKAHLVLSALRHRAAELGDQAVVVRADTYGEALAQVRRAARRLRPDLARCTRLRGAPARARGAAAPGLRHGAGGLRALGGPPARRPAHGELLPDCEARARRADGRRRARGRTVELRPREPRAAAAHADTRRPRAVAGAGGRDRRRGPARPGPLGGRRRRPVRRPRRPAPLRRHPRRGGGGPRPVHRPPAADVRPVRGRHARRRPVALPLDALRGDEPRPDRPARGRRPRGGRLPVRPRAPRERRGVRPPAHGLAGLRVARLLAHRSARTSSPTRSRRTPRCRPGSATWTPTPSRRAACATCSARCATWAGCTTSRA